MNANDGKTYTVEEVLTDGRIRQTHYGGGYCGWQRANAAYDELVGLIMAGEAPEVFEISSLIFTDGEPKPEIDQAFGQAWKDDLDD